MSFWDRLKKIKPIYYFSKGSRWIILLICFVISAILWLAIALKDTYTKRISILIESPALPAKYHLDDTKGIPEEIDLDINATGIQLLNYTFEQWLAPKHKLKLAIDTLQIQPEGGYISIGRDELLRQIKNTNDIFNQYFGSSNDAKLTLYPDYVSFSYAPLTERTVGVFFAGQIDYGEEGNRVCNSFIMSPEEVKAYGISTAIDTIGPIGTEPYPIKVENGLSRHKVALVAPEGVRLSPDSITITTNVVPLKYNFFVTNHIDVHNLEEGYNIRLFPSTIKVSYLAVEGINVSDISREIRPYVDVDDIVEGAKTLRIKLPSVPKELHMIQLEPDVVEFIIEKI